MTDFKASIIKILQGKIVNIFESYEKNGYKQERNGNFRTKTVITNKSFYKLNSKMERTEERISDLEDRTYHQLHPIYLFIYFIYFSFFIHLRF